MILLSCVVGTLKTIMHLFIWVLTCNKQNTKYLKASYQDLQPQDRSIHGLWAMAQNSYIFLALESGFTVLGHILMWLGSHCPKLMYSPTHDIKIYSPGEHSYMD